VLTYFLNDFEMVSVAPIITGITLVFTFHIRCISIVISKSSQHLFESHSCLMGLQHLITYMLLFHNRVLLLLLLLSRACLKVKFVGYNLKQSHQHHVCNCWLVIAFSNAQCACVCLIIQYSKFGIYICNARHSNCLTTTGRYSDRHGKNTKRTTHYKEPSGRLKVPQHLTAGLQHRRFGGTKPAWMSWQREISLPLQGLKTTAVQPRGNS
jgi:hypothetical protein